jgi:hypothetical protein
MAHDVFVAFIPLQLFSFTTGMGSHAQVMLLKLPEGQALFAVSGS